MSYTRYNDTTEHTVYTKYVLHIKREKTDITALVFLFFFKPVSLFILQNRLAPNWLGFSDMGYRAIVSHHQMCLVKGLFINLSVWLCWVMAVHWAEHHIGFPCKSMPQFTQSKSVLFVYKGMCVCVCVPVKILYIVVCLSCPLIMSLCSFVMWVLVISQQQCFSIQVRTSWSLDCQSTP